MKDYTQAPLDPRMRALLDHAVKLTRTPRAVTEEDVRGLKELGFTDREVFDATQVTAYFNYTNRVMMGLGAEPRD